MQVHSDSVLCLCLVSCPMRAMYYGTARHRIQQEEEEKEEEEKQGVSVSPDLVTHSSSNRNSIV